MMMDVLERSLDTDVYHERDPRAFQNYQMRPLPIIKILAKRSAAPVFVIKTLCELQDLKFLLNEFSPSKAVWLVRHYEDVVNSMLVSFRDQAKLVQKLAVDRASGGWWGMGMSDETHSVICKLVHSGLSDASAAAIQWYLRNILLFEKGLDRDPRVHLVGYEALVTDPHEQFRKIFDFLDLSYTPKVAAGIFASSIKRYAPVHRACGARIL